MTMLICCNLYWQFHFKVLLLEHAPPPPAIAEYAAANLIEMGFPQRGAEGVIVLFVLVTKM